MTVYITQEMRGRDLSDAAVFGELDLLMPAKEQVALSAGPMIRRMERKLAKFCDDDYLLLSGDPACIAAAGALAAKFNNGRFKVLKWDRLEERYYPISIDIHQRTEVK